VRKSLLHVFEQPYFSETSDSLPSTEILRSTVRVDLLEALLLAACFAVIVIPVPSPHFRGNNRITDSCVTRNDPRKENRKIYPLLYSIIIRFSFRWLVSFTTNLDPLLPQSWYIFTSKKQIYFIPTKCIKLCNCTKVL